MTDIWPLVHAERAALATELADLTGDKQVAMRLAEQLGTTPADTLARFRQVVTSTTKPPLPVIAMLARRSCTARTSAGPWASTATTRSPR